MTAPSDTPAPGRGSRTSSVLILVGAMLSIQSGAAMAKHLFPLTGARGATALRLSFAAVILCAVWRPWRHRLTRRDLRAIAAYGVVLGVMNLTFYLALERIPLGIAIALEFIGPLTLAIVSSRRAYDVVWAALAAAGIWCIIPAGKAAATAVALDPVGVGFVLVAGACWALYIILGQRAGTNVHGGTATALGMVTAACVAVPLSLVPSPPSITPVAVVLPLALVIAVLSSALPYSLEMVALQRLPARTFGILMSVEPALGALLGLAFLHEHLLPLQWTGIACVVLASAGSTATAAVAPSQVAPAPPD